MQSDSDSRKVTKNLTLSRLADPKRAVVRASEGVRGDADPGLAITFATENAISRSKIVQNHSSTYSDLLFKLDHTSLPLCRLRKSK
ncbi:MAG: hypothetical protein HKL81_07410 [Acidimicrobiaceae bacterium]|nr:hypothetical protein [Acidimicrobiaceae bacterium]